MGIPIRAIKPAQILIEPTLWILPLNFVRLASAAGGPPELGAVPQADGAPAEARPHLRRLLRVEQLDLEQAGKAELVKRAGHGGVVLQIGCGKGGVEAVVGCGEIARMDGMCDSSSVANCGIKAIKFPDCKRFVHALEPW